MSAVLWIMFLRRCTVGIWITRSVNTLSLSFLLCYFFLGLLRTLFLASEVSCRSLSFLNSFAQLRLFISLLFYLYFFDILLLCHFLDDMNFAAFEGNIRWKFAFLAWYFGGIIVEDPSCKLSIAWLSSLWALIFSFADLIARDITLFAEFRQNSMLLFFFLSDSIVELVVLLLQTKVVLLQLFLNLNILFQLLLDDFHCILKILDLFN